MPLGNQQIEHIAKLAKLQLTPREIDRLSTDLSWIVAYFQQLQEVDINGVQPSPGSSEINVAGCDDIILPSLDRAKVLSNAPEDDGEFFLVPRVMK